MSCFFYLKNILGTKIRYEVLFFGGNNLASEGMVHITAALIRRFSFELVQQLSSRTFNWPLKQHRYNYVWLE